ncbi:MAG: hypothetical protein K9L85_02845 [Candidatus Peribacteraceae bacterium]|nr:hypothetical protein [Candidatus Peribacteraceae bacterium]
MRSFIFSANSLISWGFKVFMLFAAGYFFIVGDFLLAGFAFLSMAISLIPAIVDRSYNTNLPWTLDFFLTAWLALSLIGEADFYDRFWWWDNALHFAGTAVLVYLAFVLVFALNFTKKIRLSIPMIGFLTFLIGIAFGGAWEILEFWAWKFLAADAIGIGNPPDFELAYLDTLSDLQLDAAASILIALLGMNYVARQRHVHVREFMRPFIEIFDEKARAAGEEVRDILRHEKELISKKFHKKRRK